MRIIRKLIREILQSHTLEPAPGDSVLNTNPGCQHYQSRGVVQGIEDLPFDRGRVVIYMTTNSGDSWKLGDVLKKTMDQIEIVN